MVAALSAAAGVGATRVVQHLTASGPAAAGMPGTAAADRQGNLNDEAVYQAVEPGVVDGPGVTEVWGVGVTCPFSLACSC